MRYAFAVLQISTIFSCSVLGGCNFESYLESPEVAGNFKNDGAPEKGVEVLSGPMVDTETLCNGLSKVGETDETGGFFIPAKAKTAYFGLPPSFKQKASATVVCFSRHGQKPFFGTMLVVPRQDTKQIRISCSIPTHPTGHFEDGHVCYGAD
jgi:hypothetical protein